MKEAKINYTKMEQVRLLGSASLPNLKQYSSCRIYAVRGMGEANTVCARPPWIMAVRGQMGRKGNGKAQRRPKTLHTEGWIGDHHKYPLNLYKRAQHKHYTIYIRYMEGCEIIPVNRRSIRIRDDERKDLYVHWINTFRVQNKPCTTQFFKNFLKLERGYSKLKRTLGFLV